MRLFLTRDQAKGLIGGVNFELRARVSLTKDEAGLVNKYKAAKEVLLIKEIKIPFTKKTVLLNIKIGDLITGQTFKCKDIADILEYETNVKEACEVFKNYLEVMKNFGGEELIEYASLTEDKNESTKQANYVDASEVELSEDDNLEFCYHCGAKLTEKTKICPECSNEL